MPSGPLTPLPTLAPKPTPATDDFRIGRPQQRREIGDVERAFATYEATRKELIDLFLAQDWYKDGLDRAEALFIERSLAFVARYGGPRTDYLRNETVERKLIRYERVAVSEGEVELLLIFEPGQDGDRQMAFLKAAVPVLERLVGVQFPERVLTIINGRFGINDFNEGQFVRVDRCCTTSAGILAHELSHAYWSIAASWFDEGMADIYAVLIQNELSSGPPPGWRVFSVDIDAYHRSRQAAAARFPNLVLTRRFLQDGLYEAADAFLLDIRDILGPDAFAAAARDIYLASDFNRFGVTDKRVEDIFLAHAAADARDAVMSLFNRSVWGDNGERYRALQEREAP